MDSGIKKISSREEMQAVAAAVAKELMGGDVLLLYGELGSGKTTFVQGLAGELGIADRVTSPTFTIVGEYTVPLASSANRSDLRIARLVHVDLYRLEEKTVLSDPAVCDVLERAQEPGRLTVIEWADRLRNNTPKKAQRITFQHVKTAVNERTLTFW